MKNLKLEIAGYNIWLEASANGPDLAVSSRFLRNLSTGPNYDVHIKVHSEKFNIPAKAERVFHAPFVEEKEGVLTENNPEFWSVWRCNSKLYIKVKFPLSGDRENAILKFSLDELEWDLWTPSDKYGINPLEYPLDGLILYYLTAIKKDIFIHASGVNFRGKGFLFSGVSGKGKSTMASLWDNYGAKVVHDDRLIIKKTVDGYRMFNTPVYDKDVADSSVLNRIFIIEHSNDNRLILLKESAAVSQVMANCIQHTWDTGIISQLSGSISVMCNIIPVHRLLFRPENSVIDLILGKDELHG